LILEHLEFVRHVLGKTIAHLPETVDKENLEAAGVLGLVEAANQYDPGRGVAFKSFAFHRIRGAILDELRRNSPLPQKMLQQISQVRRVSETMPPPVTPERIARKTGLSLEEVERTIEAMRFGRMQSCDEAPTSLNSLRKRPATTPQAEIEDHETRQVLADAIEQLPERERLAITLYYLEDLRLKEIGALLKLSESRVSRVLSKAEFRLAQKFRSQS
jgi:RNA polymerase sigma factor for flagellar operon FliA